MYIRYVKQDLQEIKFLNLGIITLESRLHKGGSKMEPVQTRFNTGVGK